MNNKQLSHLFYDTDLIWTGDLYTLMPVEDSIFFCINPLKDVYGSRTDANVSAYRNFLFEFDGPSLEEQREAIGKVKNLTSVVYSGSKSYHAIYSLSDTLTVSYKLAWLALSTYIQELTGLQADPSCKNPSRLSRLAGATRPETGSTQTLVLLGPYITNNFILELINKYGLTEENKSTAVVTDFNPHMSIDDFEAELSKFPGLKNKIANAHLWAKPQNNYPELLKLTLWVIDSIGAPEHVTLTYFKSVMTNKLKMVGYDVNKLDVAVKNAYKYKF